VFAIYTITILLGPHTKMRGLPRKVDRFPPVAVKIPGEWRRDVAEWIRMEWSGKSCLTCARGEWPGPETE